MGGAESTGGREIPQYLYHYTDKVQEILESGVLYPSTEGNFGPGVYLTAEPPSKGHTQISQAIYDCTGSRLPTGAGVLRFEAKKMEAQLPRDMYLFGPLPNTTGSQEWLVRWKKPHSEYGGLTWNKAQKPLSLGKSFTYSFDLHEVLQSCSYPKALLQISSHPLYSEFSLEERRRMQTYGVWISTDGDDRLRWTMKFEKGTVGSVFRIVFLHSGRVAFQNIRTGKWLCADGQKWMKADREKCGSWEEFKLELTEWPRYYNNTMQYFCAKIICCRDNGQCYQSVTDHFKHQEFDGGHVFHFLVPDSPTKDV
eukprot:TRINITY_DN114133_c0_g1_i1.p1 TRINITY_DN114133_c0_g1~~TRINITY_DN114133_c0_g1_i1.p1  ORF type:complete len:329 (-),score=3.42 TRINITY_DN114133_c0_g1_i1:72-1001(-)